MILSSRRILLALSIIIVSCAVLAWWRPEQWAWLSAVVAVCGTVLLLMLSHLGGSAPAVTREPDEIGDLSESRRAELIRGTSKFLREMRYRYSVRLDRTGSDERVCFTAEVNSVRLGFIPALLTDNSTDRQGYGYVAFVYDRHRWRGPGLPCPSGKAEALQHAARCVSPLEDGDEDDDDGSQA